MTQKSRPSADISTGSWSQTPLDPKLNEPSPNDGSKVSSHPGTLGDTFEVKLANLAWPTCGDQRLTVRLRKADGSLLPTTVTLLQGDAVIAGQEVEPSQSFGSVVQTLSPEQIARITDYTALSVRVSAGRPQIGCCPDIPALLTATIHNSTCGVLNGVTVPLCWNGVTNGWRGSVDGVCGLTVSLQLACTGSGPSGFMLSGSWSGGTCTIPFGAGPHPSSTCAPLLLHFNHTGVIVSSACPCCASTTISFDIDITE